MYCCAALLGLAFMGSQSAWSAPPVAVADFALPALDGRNYRLSEYRGEVVAVAFWASWCGGCREQLAVLRDLEGYYRNWGLRVISVSLDDRPQEAAAVATALGLTYPVLHDRDKAVSKAWDPERLPATYLLDRSGAVRFVHEVGDGPPDTRKLIARMRMLLDE